MALSGGSDSLALFHLLLSLKVDFMVAHVNHGVRVESAKEEIELRALCKKQGIEIHVHTISAQEYSGNFENSAREIRYNFFYQLFKKKGFTALVLGHQKDDVAETTLKRIFEGAHLTSLGSIKEITHYQSMPLWRPLLKTPKKELEDWLESKNITPFIDQTNFDPKFTRSRMRKILIPSLEREFGKGITNPLTRLSDYALDLEEYLDSQIKPLVQIMKNDHSIDLSKYPPLHKVVFIHFIRKVLYPTVATNRQLQEMVECYKKGGAHKKWLINCQTLQMNKGNLVLLNRNFI